jgi:hypothetical protein
MANKYSSVYADVYSIFGAGAWTSENIKTFPENFTGSSIGNEYIRVAIVSGGSLDNVNPPRSVSGQLLIDIFVPAGAGLARSNQIADKLDSYLAGKLMQTTGNGSTQLGSSSLTNLGNDAANPSLYRSIYSIPFNYFGK